MLSLSALINKITYFYVINIINTVIHKYFNTMEYLYFMRIKYFIILFFVKFSNTTYDFMHEIGRVLLFNSSEDIHIANSWLMHLEAQMKRIQEVQIKMYFTFTIIF